MNHTAADRAPERDLWWRVAGRFARLFDRDERAAACGDLIESGATGARVLLEVAGLVVRRQAESNTGTLKHGGGFFSSC